MEESEFLKVAELLTQYLDNNHLRKTPERYAILKAIAQFKGHFTLNELSEGVEKDNFRVSRATLYNNLQLLAKVPLVVSHRYSQQTIYEATFQRPNHCHQVCKVCGKVTELSIQQIAPVIEMLKMKRFHKEFFTLEVHGICSACYTKMNRRKKNKTNKKPQKTK